MYDCATICIDAFCSCCAAVFVCLLARSLWPCSFASQREEELHAALQQYKEEYISPPAEIGMEQVRRTPEPSNVCRICTHKMS